MLEFEDHSETSSEIVVDDFVEKSIDHLSQAIAKKTKESSIGLYHAKRQKLIVDDLDRFPKAKKIIRKSKRIAAKKFVKK